VTIRIAARKETATSIEPSQSRNWQILEKGKVTDEPQILTVLSVMHAPLPPKAEDVSKLEELIEKAELFGLSKVWFPVLDLLSS